MTKSPDIEAKDEDGHIFMMDRRPDPREQRARPKPANTSNQPRQNEYFVPRDGIDREVITADICRYLGNDALVRPGNYTDVGFTICGQVFTSA